MYKKTITFENLEEQEETKDFYFVLTEADLAEMEASIPGGYGAYLRKIAKEKDVNKMIEYMKFIISKSYVEKTPYGFTKLDEHGAPLFRYFAATNAYSELFMLLALNDEEASAFCNGILPKKLRDQLDAQAIEAEKKRLLAGED